MIIIIKIIIPKNINIVRNKGKPSLKYKQNL